MIKEWFKELLDGIISNLTGMFDAIMPKPVWNPSKEVNNSNIYDTIILEDDYMMQRKRPGGSGGLGYYTSWEKSTPNGCIYCGESAKTREHVPSKAFLVEPYPENLLTIPACFKCNNGFSDDEKYVSCFLIILKESVYEDYTRHEDTVRRLKKDEKLKLLPNEQIRKNSDKVYYTMDETRLFRILLKLAKGHAGFEFDYVNFDGMEIKIWYDYSFSIPENVLLDFNQIPMSQLYPEVGSRGLMIVENLDTGEAVAPMLWNDVQEGQYRYQVSYDESGGICVKIVILEFLYSRIDFK